ncbi:hypothetical protein PVAP13_7NG349300 [Panicum virgatum]|uniref:Uncharacterized protein n=1 Tax=Panicum virgatum TaxID=38727 RepID=A0A8T0PXL8_PANVG|nr:hypothetical protein PVAP13_7NG349300 [Panicum virgatum]
MHVRCMHRCMAPVQMLIKINKHGGTPATSMAAGRNFSSVMPAATATIPLGGECGKPGSPRTTAMRRRFRRRRQARQSAYGGHGNDSGRRRMRRARQPHIVRPGDDPLHFVSSPI